MKPLHVEIWSIFRKSDVRSWIPTGLSIFYDDGSVNSPTNIEFSPQPNESGVK